jgi:hypothetical protein
MPEIPGRGLGTIGLVQPPTSIAATASATIVPCVRYRNGIRAFSFRPHSPTTSVFPAPRSLPVCGPTAPYRCAVQSVLVFSLFLYATVFPGSILSHISRRPGRSLSRDRGDWHLDLSTCVHHINLSSSPPVGGKCDHPAIRRPRRFLIGALIGQDLEIRSIRPDRAYLKPSIVSACECQHVSSRRPIGIRIVVRLESEPPGGTSLHGNRVNLRGPGVV